MTGAQWSNLVSCFDDGCESIWDQFLEECHFSIIQSIFRSKIQLSTGSVLSLEVFGGAMTLEQFVVDSISYFGRVFDNLEDNDSFDLMRAMVEHGYDFNESKFHDIESVAEGYYWGLYFSVCCKLGVTPGTVAVRDFCLLPSLPALKQNRLLNHSYDYDAPTPQEP